MEFDLVPFIRFKCDISTRFTGSWCSMFGRKYRIKKKDNDWIIRLDTCRRFLRWHYETYFFHSKIIRSDNKTQFRKSNLHHYCYLFIFVLRVMYVFIVREEWKGVLLLLLGILLDSWLSRKYLRKKMEFTYIHIVFSYICWFKDI